ncbi:MULTISPECIES: hypothetical protein [Paenibacillus]|uniref:hypothetical protein n=1 Tax=Paenibacillus TaxID=44249 RepID=UPI00077CB818|nr:MULTISPECIES: hypothetical protein [Paenibacillus]AOK88550.1 hypothetical protein AOU00_01385 [Paenibacillus polymyxa]KYG95716.1 hypothetical protein AZE31_18225 [Paenibacillus polymyxa]PNQ80602.1 hypothetical protein C1T21_15210 [Paenibacillus sp. F4]WDZ63673.1 hypothetical protein MF628_08860 [Paenibacillus polymyxa]SPY16133.1 Uncharacterised protein [Paenibacillus polymyxa]
MKKLDLNKLEDEPVEVQQAVAFYASHTINKVRVTTEERYKHYSVLEEVGLLKPLKSVVEP